MNDQSNKALEKKKAREQALAIERQNIMGMTPEKALEAILDHPYPVTLVQSFAEEDLYLLMHAIGPDDALPMLGLASNEQWQYLLDMEEWTRDRMDIHATTQWLDRLLKADPDRFTHWIVHDQRASFEYYLYRNIELHIREYEQDPAEIGDGFFSEDNTHYLRLRKYPQEIKDAESRQKERDTFLLDLLKRISVYDFPAYQQMLLGSSVVIPAEAEEEMLRLRSARLAEKGFLPFDDAVGIYQPLSVSDLYRRGRKSQSFDTRRVETYPLPIDGPRADKSANLFARTLVRIQDQPTLQRLESEFAALCNQMIAADQQKVREKAALSQVVEKVGAYISIGLETVAEQATDDDPYRSANLIQDYLLADIFRVGFGRGLQLKWKADRWRQASWFAGKGLPLGFWGEAWLGVLGGLLLKRPLFYDNYVTGALYRDFATLDDIHQTEQVLAQIIAFDDLLSLMEIDISASSSAGFLTYQNLLLTLWANRYLSVPGDGKTPRPLSLNQFRDFFQILWKSGAQPRQIKDAMREHFLGWLAERCALTAFEIAERMGPALEVLFAEIETELGPVDLENLDPRYIFLFLFKRPD